MHRPPPRREPNVLPANTKNYKGLSGARLEEREREFISTVQCLPSCNKHAVPIVSGAPVVHYVNIPSSRLYSDPEQEVISYPTSAAAFLSQVVQVPRSRGVMESGQGRVRRGGKAGLR